MALTRTTVSLLNTVTLTAGAADTYAEVDMSSYYDTILHVIQSTGGTAPTLTSRVTPLLGFDTNGDGSADVWACYGGSLSNVIHANGGVSYNVRLPRAAKWLRVYAGGNTGQNCTVEAWLTVTTGF
jgi:hypothetical protein